MLSIHENILIFNEIEESYQRQIENPLLGFIDSITLEQVEQPCISPYGHVLG